MPQCPNDGYRCADLGIRGSTSESEEEHRCAPHVQFVHLFELVYSFHETSVMLTKVAPCLELLTNEQVGKLDWIEEYVDACERY